MGGPLRGVLKALGYLKEGISGLRKEIGDLPKVFAKQVEEVLDKKLDEKFAQLTFKVSSGPPGVLRISQCEEFTLEVLRQLDHPVTSADVAAVTHRVRAVESGYLCRLERIGIVDKMRKGRKVVFTLREECRDKR